MKWNGKDQFCPQGTFPRLDRQRNRNQPIPANGIFRVYAVPSGPRGTARSHDLPSSPIATMASCAVRSKPLQASGATVLHRREHRIQPDTALELHLRAEAVQVAGHLLQEAAEIHPVTTAPSSTPPSPRRSASAGGKLGCAASLPGRRREIREGWRLRSGCCPN